MRCPLGLLREINMVNRDWIVNLNVWVCLFERSSMINVVRSRWVLSIQVKWLVYAAKISVVWILSCETLDNSSIVCFRSTFVVRSWVWRVSYSLLSPSLSIPWNFSLLFHLPIGLLVLLTRVFNSLSFFITYVTNKYIIKT